jgi:hypothetical protein
LNEPGVFIVDQGNMDPADMRKIGTLYLVGLRMDV